MLLWTVRQRNACDGIICTDWKTVLFERGESETDCGEKKIAINSNKWWNSPTKKGFYVYLCSGFSSEWARKKKLACEFSLPPLLLYPRTYEVLGWDTRNTLRDKKRENRCPRNSRYSRALKILIIKTKPSVRQADRIDYKYRYKE